jgi:hypothetical protein
MEQILLREHEAGRSFALRNRVDDAVRAREASAAAAVLARNDECSKPRLAQPLNIGEREGGRPVVFAPVSANSRASAVAVISMSSSAVSKIMGRVPRRWQA